MNLRGDVHYDVDVVRRARALDESPLAAEADEGDHLFDVQPLRQSENHRLIIERGPFVTDQVRLRGLCILAELGLPAVRGAARVAVEPRAVGSER